MKNDIDPVIRDDLPNQRGLTDRAEHRHDLYLTRDIADLAPDCVKRGFAVIQKHQARRADMQQLAADFRPYRAARSGDKNIAAGIGLAHAGQFLVQSATAQKI